LRESINGRVVTNLAFTMLAFAAIFCVTAYIGPVVASVTGFSPKQIGLMQSFVGLGSLVGVAIGGTIAGRTHSSIAVVAILTIVSLVSFAYTPLMSAHSLPPALAVAALALLIFSGAAALFSLAPIIQVRLIDCAPRAPNIVLAMNAAMLFLGQAIGASVGGLITDQLALRWLGVAGAVFGLCGVALALVARRRNARAAA
jgi:predicted MFS family arabinose efflux permease